MAVDVQGWLLDVEHYFAEKGFMDGHLNMDVTQALAHHWYNNVHLM